MSLRCAYKAYWFALCLPSFLRVDSAIGLFRKAVRNDTTKGRRRAHTAVEAAPPGSARDAPNLQRRRRRRREGRRCARLDLFASLLLASAAGALTVAGAEAAGPSVCVPPPPQLLRARLATTHAPCRQDRVKTRAVFRFQLGAVQARTPRGAEIVSMRHWNLRKECKADDRLLGHLRTIRADCARVHDRVSFVDHRCFIGLSARIFGCVRKAACFPGGGFLSVECFGSSKSSVDVVLGVHIAGQGGCPDLFPLLGC
ncbi:hypothetical protein MTO96_030201 [Rhipicephalus appendiculatus]